MRHTRNLMKGDGRGNKEWKTESERENDGRMLHGSRLDWALATPCA